jgi:hypothetical protein
MSHLVVVSNRLHAGATAASADERAWPVGGLASAIAPALERLPGSL